MPKRQHPESKNLTKSVPKSDKRQNFVSALIHDARTAETDRGQWEENLTRWFKKRQGIRPGSVNFPWPGASNVNISLIDEKIRKMTPNYLNLAFEGEPVVTIQAVGATPLEVASSVEIYLDWLLRFGMNRVPGKNYFEALTLVIDWMQEQGFSFAKVVWHHSQRSYARVLDLESLPQPTLDFIQDPLTTDDEIRILIAAEGGFDLSDESDLKGINKAIEQFRKGERYITFQMKETVYSGPRVIPVRAKDLIVPNDTTDLETARSITHRMYLTANEIKQSHAVGKYPNKEAVDRVVETPKKPKSSKYSTLETVKGDKEGVMGFLGDSELIEVWEIYAWYDLDGDGQEEKVVITVHPETEEILRFIAFPYDHGNWPFVRFDNELLDDRWYSSRGMPRILDHYQTILTNQENAKLNYLQWKQSPQFKYRIGRVNWSQGRAIPFQGIGVHRQDDLEPLRIESIDLSFDTEMQKVRQLAETYIGQPDLALSNMFNPQERRTAREVSESVALSKQIFSLNARLFRNSLQKMYNQILDLIVQYGPEEQFVQVTGKPPIQLTRQQLASDVVIVPSGDFTMLSKVLEEQRDFALLQLLMQDQSGAINHLEAIREYLLKHYPRQSTRVLRSPKEFQQIQQLRIEAQRQQVEDKKEIAGRSSNGSATPRFEP